jgi:hypothetical protein
MAKQLSYFKLKGLLGNFSFYKSVYGFLVRRKTGVSRDTVLKDPRFVRTRENASEFGTAARTGKRLRIALAVSLGKAKDTFMVQRLTAMMLKVLQKDNIHKRGERTVESGDFRLLEDFDFNGNAPLERIFKAPFCVSIGRERATLTIETFTPEKVLIGPKGATHFKFVFGMVAVNAATVTYSYTHTSVEAIAYTRGAISPMELTLQYEAMVSGWGLAVVGIVHMQLVNGRFFDHQDASYNALRIVRTVACE